MTKKILRMIKTLKLYTHHLDSGQTTQVHIERTPQVFHSFIHLFLFRIKQFMPFVLPFLRCQPVSMSCDRFYGIVQSSKKKIGTLKLYAHNLDSGQTTQVHIERTPQVFHSFIHLFLFRIKQFMPFVLPFLRCQPVSMSCDKFYGIVWSSKKKIGSKVH